MCEIDENLNKERFLALCRKYITREGIEPFLTWLQGTDFFHAPASTKYHLNIPGGLCQHSLNVYDSLCDMIKKRDLTHAANMPVSVETVALVSLFHDICKADFYKLEMRNTKKDGNWIQVPYYTIDDELPYGHGEKSVYILQKYMQLTDEEAFAIRFHMGNTEDVSANFNVAKTYMMYPLAFYLNVADSEAAFVIEKDADDGN